MKVLLVGEHVCVLAAIEKLEFSDSVPAASSVELFV